MAERFLFQNQIKNATAILADDQAHHLVRVMRAQPGEQVVLFDGKGTEHKATIRAISKKAVELSIESSTTSNDPNDPAIFVAAALPKGDRQKFLIEKLVELGANGFIPLCCERGVAEPSSKALQRIQKQVVEASKQCRRNWLMEVESGDSVESLATRFHDDQLHKIVADPYSADDASTIDLGGCIIAVGPEGGFTDSELQHFENANWNRVCFSPNILRIETAAAAAVAVLRSRWSFNTEVKRS